MPKKFSRESGRTMIEMLGVLAIIGILTVGSIKLYSIAMRNMKRSQVIQDVQLLVQQIRSLYSNAQDYSDLDSSVIVALQLEEKNPFGGKYELSPSQEDATIFEIHITELSTENCLYFKIYNWEDSVIQNQKGRGGAIANPPTCNSTRSDNKIVIQYQ
ncbi:MAG: type II secretion system protein [Alphaproteobacteria bacterium]|nr:type II secretion system protein [Alphaproteobacteria bacterium]